MQSSSSNKHKISQEFPSTPRFISLDGSDLETKRQQLLDYFVSTWEQYEALFIPLKDEALYARAEPLRHPLIFYFGHTATFYVNKMILAQFTDARVVPELESMFAIGVDEMSWDDLDSSHYDWPTRKAAKAYRDKVKARICSFITSMEMSLPITQQSPAWLILMGIEHERIHLETSSVIMRMLPLDLINTELANSWQACTKSGDVPDIQWLSVPATTVKLGKSADEPIYGWDNEYGNDEQQINQFEVATTLVSNQEFLEFVKAGGYQEARYWTPEGKEWLSYTQSQHPKFWRPTLNGNYKQRNLFSEMPLPMNWPVEVNYLEAKAFVIGLGSRQVSQLDYPWKPNGPYFDSQN